MKRRVALWAGAFLLVAVIAFGAGAYVDQSFPDYMPYLAHHSAGRVNATQLQEAIRLIQADYIDGNVDTTKLSQSTVRGLIQGLGDPFSTYYDPGEYKRLQDFYQGQYSGIGVYLTLGSDYPVITGTVPGSPAAGAGLQNGDSIVKVGDKDMKGVTSDQATKLIQGPNGTKVTLTIARGAETLTVTLTRAEIHVKSVYSTVLANQVLYVRIYSFGSSTSDEFASALSSGLPGAKGMVLDLRDDPGGFISAADDVISQFISSGETFELRDRNGTVDKHQVTGTHKAAAVPLVVLVDANTVSAAEIVSGSLQVHQRAKLVGTKTFGKGSVQQDFVLSDGADIHITIKRWYLPDGQTIDRTGLQPDVVVALASPTDEFDVIQPSKGYAKDTQLNSALSMLAAG